MAPSNACRLLMPCNQCQHPSKKNNIISINAEIKHSSSKQCQHTNEMTDRGNYTLSIGTSWTHSVWWVPTAFKIQYAYYEKVNVSIDQLNFVIFFAPLEAQNYWKNEGKIDGNCYNLQTQTIKKARLSQYIEPTIKKNCTNCKNTTIYLYFSFESHGNRKNISFHLLMKFLCKWKIRIYQQQRPNEFLQIASFNQITLHTLNSLRLYYLKLWLLYIWYILHLIISKTHSGAF